MKNPGLVRAFTAAKRYLSDKGNGRKTRFICHAINQAYLLEYLITYSECISARQVLAERLGNCLTIDDWLCDNTSVGDAIYEMHTETYQYRLRWLDSLIKEFS